MAMSHVSVAYFPQCRVSNLRNEYVACHYIFSPHVACHYALCHMSNLRNAHVALSILGVKGHTGGAFGVTALTRGGADRGGVWTEVEGGRG